MIKKMKYQSRMVYRYSHHHGTPQMPSSGTLSIRNLWNSGISLFLLSAFFLIWGCASPELENSPQTSSKPTQFSQAYSSQGFSSDSGNAFDVVDCLIPGQVRRLGSQMIYMTPRRPVRATVEDCVIRGGEYVSYDRADYSTSLDIWKKAADIGNVEAQYYVAVLYEQGNAGSPDYALAAQWYEKAAEQGHRQAAMNLGSLYDQGLGVPQDSQLAFSWMTKASGLEQPTLTNLLSRSAMQQLQSLEKTVKVREKEIHVLQSSLTQAQEEKTQLQNQLVKEQSEAKAEREHLVLLEKQSQQLETDLQIANAETPKREVEIQQYQQRLQVLEKELGQKTHEGEKAKALEAKHRILQGQLVQLQQDKAQDSVLRQQQEKEYQGLKEKLEHSRQHIEHQEVEMLELTHKIENLESSAIVVASKPPGEDLGLEGPRIQIIDPPLITTRGIQVVAGRRDIFLPPNSNRSLTGRVLASAGMWELRVNGLLMEIDKEGIFTYDLPKLRTQETSVPVDIVAVDIQNKRTISSLNLLSDKSLITAQGSVEAGTEKPFGQYYALVIGNNNYKNWDPLQNAIADAEAVGKLLEAQYGFKVKFLKDASRTDILKTLNEFRKMLTDRDNLLIYYAGHGFWEKNINRGYWIPVEADLEDNSNWILLPTVTDLLHLMSAKHILVVADSCFAGKLTRSGLAQLRPGLTDEDRMDLLKTLAEKRVRTALTSGGLSPVLDSGGGGHSIFTKAFLNVLEENAEILETERVFLAVRNRVMNSAQRLNTEQIPTYAPVHMAGHESLGDFIFVPQNEEIPS